MGSSPTGSLPIRPDVTVFDRSSGSSPPAVDATPDEVLSVLISTGRWRDAAAYYPAVPDGRPLERAQLLLAAAQPAEARAILAESTSRDEQAPTEWRHFIEGVAATRRGDRSGIAELVGCSSVLPPHPLVALLMVRAAEHAGAFDVAVHYAQQLFRVIPGDVDAARVVSLDLLQRGEWVQAAQILDVAERAAAADQPSPLAATLVHLTAAGRAGDAAALVTVGRFLHREKDPTQPITAQERAARARWRDAYRKHGPRRTPANLGRLAILVTGVTASALIRNPAPILVLAACVGIWVRRRALPGMDLRTSRIVRAITDPMQVLRTRRYRTIDVFTFIWTLVVGCGLATRLPKHPPWLIAAGLGAACVFALAMVRTRRRWSRRQRAQLQPPPADPTRCVCLTLDLLRASEADAYLDHHLFRVGTAPAAPQWPVLQCLTTYARFLHLPEAQLAVKLPTIN